MKTKFILFDFDGVILDSNAMVRRHVFSHWGDDDEAQKKTHEGNVWKGKGEVVPVTLDSEQEKISASFFFNYRNDMKECVVFDGMREVVASLAERYTLYIVSSTISDIIREYLEHCGMTNFFTDIYGVDIAISKSTKIAMIMEREKVDPRDCIMITDSLGDVREAEHVGVASIGVTWGVHNRESFEKGKTFRICDNPTELLATIDEYFG